MRFNFAVALWVGGFMLLLGAIIAATVIIYWQDDPKSERGSDADSEFGSGERFTPYTPHPPHTRFESIEDSELTEWGTHRPPTFMYDEWET